MADVRRSSGQERGSALLLVPAATLVILALGSMAVDQAIVLGRQRDLVELAQAAAADGAAVGVDQDGLRRTGDLAYDQRRIDRAIRTTVGLEEPGASVTWTLSGRTLTVRIDDAAPVVFGKAIFRTSSVPVTARASATLVLRDPSP